MATTSNKEKRVAQKMAELVNDITLNLNIVGTYLADEEEIIYQRLVEVFNSAEQSRADLELTKSESGRRKLLARAEKVLSKLPRDPDEDI
jgi:hypothetical protein